jgi:hypothetical protein
MKKAENSGAGMGSVTMLAHSHRSIIKNNHGLFTIF